MFFDIAQCDIAMNLTLYNEMCHLLEDLNNFQMISVIHYKTEYGGKNQAKYKPD